MPLSPQAESRQRRVAAVATQTASQVVRLWQRVEPSALTESFETVAPSMVGVATAAQTGLAAGSNRYVASLGVSDGLPAGGEVDPAMFAGVDGSGRSLETLMFGAVTTTKEGIGAGLAVPRAFEAGAAYLSAMLQTVLADTARQSDMAASVGRGYVYYIRVVQPGACGRCLILAGSDRFSRPFQRHPACKCTLEPMTREARDAYDPFDGMTDEQMDRAFTKAGAQAIRDGADMQQVVSARRGAMGGIGTASGSRAPSARWRNSQMRQTVVGYRPDGSPVLSYTTVEGTTRRGQFYRLNRTIGGTGDSRVGRYTQTNRVRFMPETIYDLAQSNDEVRILLIDSGYLTPSSAFRGLTGTDLSAALRANRLRADRIYARNGIVPVRL